MVFTPQDRIQLLDNPTALPAQCMICHHPGGDNSRKFIDWGMSIDWFGQVIFCTECLAFIATNCGFIKSEDADRAKLNETAAWAQRDILIEENQRLRNVLADLYTGVNPIPSPSVGSGNLDSTQAALRIDESSLRASGKPNSDANESGGIKGTDSLYKSAKSSAKSADLDF